VPDRKQKGALQPSCRSAEVLLVKELVAALQANEEVAAACLKLQAQLQGKPQLTVVEGGEVRRRSFATTPACTSLCISANTQQHISWTYLPARCM
jgi:Tfp pilus assembly major pilin PilA